jgi:transcriptional regulator with XRE-family HTH domain
MAAPLLQKMGSRIRDARRRAGLRQIDVYERIGLTYRHYQEIEAGRVNITILTLYKLARLFRSRMAELIDDDG